MKAKELRIGNKFECMGMIQTVFELCDNTDRGRITQAGYEYIIRCEENANQYKPIEMQPIPLTEEWLMKFGFELTISNKDSGYKQYGINKNGFDIMFSIDCNCWPECFIENIGIEITYIHQLQNVFFALCGEELIIK